MSGGVTTYLMGGCGNQMFQYAAGLALARKRDSILLVDRSRYDSDTEFRMYSLGLFRGTKNVQAAYVNGHIVREQGLPYNPALFANLPQGVPVCIYGYWQTEKYFAELKDELKETFAFGEGWHNERTSETLRAIQQNEDRSVFLTVRRTDFVNNSFHGTLGMDYYEAAADLIASKVEDPCFFVFSDEPEWCEQNFKLKYRTVVAGNFDRTVRPHLGREDADLHLMRLCRHAVMANSSYSWWGAWLGRADDGGIVIAPKRWFLSTSEDSRDIVPTRWISI